MSMFLVYQEPSRVLLLADSLAARRHAHGAEESPETFSINTSKLALVGDGVFAAHAGTWQPAWAMLSDLSEALRKNRKQRLSYATLLKKLSEIGTRRFSEYKKAFKGADFDVRIALVTTGQARDPADIKDGFSSTILIWEAAREFKPHRSRGQIYFAGSPELSRLATATLEQPLLKKMLASSSLSAAQALLSTHAMLACLSTAISREANVVLIGDDQRHAVLQGQMHSLPCKALLAG